MVDMESAVHVLLAAGGAAVKPATLEATMASDTIESFMLLVILKL